MKKIFILFLLISSFAFAEYEFPERIFKIDELKIKIEELKKTDNYNYVELKKIKKEYIEEIIEIIEKTEYYDQENQQKSIDNLIKADKELDEFYFKQSEMLGDIIMYKAGRIYIYVGEDFKKEILVKRLEVLANLYDSLAQG